VRDVVLAVLAEDRAVGIHHDGGVVVHAGHVLLVDGQHHHEVQLLGELGEALHDRAVGRLRVGVVLLVFGDAEVGTVEELLEADDLRALSRRVARELLVFGEHGLLVARPRRLGECCANHGHLCALLAGTFCYSGA